MKGKMTFGDLTFDWHHRKSLDYDNQGKEVTKRTTTCEISQNGEVVGFGVAHCSLKDNFCRLKGRKVSLSKALAGVPKVVRTEIWEVFRTYGLNNSSKKEYWPSTSKVELPVMTL